MPADKLRIRPCLLLTIAAVLGVAVGFRVIVNGYFATGVALALAVALLAAVAGLLDLLPRTASTALGAPAKMAGGILLAVGAIVPLQMGAACGPAAVAMALAPAPLYVWLALRMLRHARASRRMLLATFFWGACVAAPLGAVLNDLGALAVAAPLGSHAAQIYGSAISPGVVEECAKGAVLLIICRRFRGALDGVLDGIVYATIVGLGFAVTENILYYGTALGDHGLTGALDVFLVRGVCTPFLHPLLTSMTGVGFGIASRAQKGSTRAAAPVLGLGAAMFLHGLFDGGALLGATAAGAIMLGFLPLFAGMLVFIRRAGRAERRTIGQDLPARPGATGVLPRPALA